MDFITLFFIALFLDLALGDPRIFIHPVTIIAKTALQLEHFTRKKISNEYCSGSLTTIIIVGGSFLLSLALSRFLYRQSSIAGDLFSIYLIYSSLAIKGLSSHAFDVYVALRHRNLELARERVGMIVGRDTEHLSEGEVVRASVESVGENMVDGIIAPILFIVFFGPVGGITYKAISTLDSTFGYKNIRYIRFGYMSAKLDDLVAFIPARLTVLFSALISPLMLVSPFRIVRLSVRDGRKHASPNSAYGEVCMATLVGGTLGGRAIYCGRETSRPVIGEGKEVSTPDQILLSIFALLLCSASAILVSLSFREVLYGI